jgi:urease accessory protein
MPICNSDLRDLRQTTTDRIPERPDSVPMIPEFMRALQFGDSMLPVGSFSFSNGLESAIQEGVVHDLDSLQSFVKTATEQAATCDGVALLLAHRAAKANDFESIRNADRAVFCRKLNEETRTMSVRMGRKLAEMAVQVIPSANLVNDWLSSIKQGTSPGTYPIGQAIVYAAMDLSEQNVFAVHQYGVAAMMLSSALRLMKINYLDVQSVLFKINHAAESDYERVAHSELDDMYTFAPLNDILAAVHVKSRIRMFMN